MGSEMCIRDRLALSIPLDSSICTLSCLLQHPTTELEKNCHRPLQAKLSPGTPSNGVGLAYIIVQYTSDACACVGYDGMIAPPQLQSTVGELLGVKRATLTVKTIAILYR